MFWSVVVVLLLALVGAVVLGVILAFGINGVAELVRGARRGRGSAR